MERGGGEGRGVQWRGEGGEGEEESNEEGRGVKGERSTMERGGRGRRRGK